MWRRAAELWAEARNKGSVTADPHALDGDAIVSADCASNVCSVGTCQPATCAPNCPNGHVAADASDCGSRSYSMQTSTCISPSCSPTCNTGATCGAPNDCGSMLCTNGLCVDPVCAPHCPGGTACNNNSNCASLNCINNMCAPASTGCSPSCANGQSCAGPGDCASRTCSAGKCVPPSTCAPNCAVGQACTSASDCASQTCTNGTCANAVGNSCHPCQVTAADPSWCQGNAQAHCALGPGCDTHPDTCAPQTVVAISPCAGARPVCAQTGDRTKCEVSSLSGACGAARAIGSGAELVLSTDLDHDGRPDLIVQNGEYTVYHQTSDGAYAPASPLAVATATAGLLGGDVTGDGLPDLVAGTYANDVAAADGGLPAPVVDLQVAAGRPDGSFAPFIATGAVFSPLIYPSVVADVDGDGVPDVVGFDPATCTAQVALGGATLRVLGAQPMGSCPPADAGHVTMPLAADVNGDGRVDVLIVFNGDGFGWILGGANGRLSAGPVTPGPDDAVFAVADVDRDGRLDMVTSSAGQFHLLHGRGDGAFDLPFFVSGAPYDVKLAAATDLDGDGWTDLVGATDAFSLEFRFGQAGGSFGRTDFSAAGGSVRSVDALAPNADGSRDLLVRASREGPQNATQDDLVVWTRRCF